MRNPFGFHIHPVEGWDGAMFIQNPDREGNVTISQIVDGRVVVKTFTQEEFSAIVRKARRSVYDSQAARS